MTVTLIINTENLSEMGARCAKEGYSSLFMVDILESDPRYIERSGTYIAAAACFERCFSSAMPSLLFDECGRPYLKDNKLYISLSHREGVAVISFSDSPVGVDVECDNYSFSFDRLSKRLLSRIKGRATPLLVKYMRGELNSYGELSELSLISSDLLTLDINSFVSGFEGDATPNIKKSTSDPILAFTVLEAASKCTGLGVSKFLSSGADISGFSADSIRYLNYTVTTFIKEH